MNSTSSSSNDVALASRCRAKWPWVHDDGVFTSDGRRRPGRCQCSSNRRVPRSESLIASDFYLKEMQHQHPMWIKKESRVSPNTTFMWSIPLIENLPLREPLPACVPGMFSNNNDAVVATLFQNLGAKPLMKFFMNVCCRMQCCQCACHLPPNNMLWLDIIVLLMLDLMAESTSSNLLRLYLQVHFPRTRNGIIHDTWFGFPILPSMKNQFGEIDSSLLGTKLWTKIIICLLKSDILVLGG